MLFNSGLTALACFVTLALSSITDDSSKPMDGNQVVFSTDTDQISQATLRACIAAPNCETYQSDHGVRIRFKAGHEPGSAAFKQRFGTNNDAMSVPLQNAAKPQNLDAVNTNVDMGDTSILYGTTKPYDALHNIWDHCGSSSCDTHSFTVDTGSVASTGQGNSAVEGWTLTITATGQYDGFGERAAYVTALLTASTKGLRARSERWRLSVKGDGVETGTVTVYTQTDYISINKFSGGALHGFLTVQVDRTSENNAGWCATAAADLATVAGAIDSTLAAFFGIIGIFCSSA